MQTALRFNENAYTVRLFLPHGDPDGLRVIDQPNWSGVGVAFPRSAYKEVSSRDEFSRTGVYILVGPGPNGSALPSLYIGQSDRVQTRFDDHHKKKDFWEWAVFFVSKDNALNVAATQYIESRLIERANSAKRCHLDNGNGPAGPNLGDADAADAGGFLRNILRVLPVLGISAFEQKENKTVVSARRLLYLRGIAKGIKGLGYVQPGGFVVRAGSLAGGSEEPTIHGYMSAIRKDLVDNKVMVPEGALFRFTQDYDLSSPSTAAGVLLGRTANGREEWKDETGKKLKKIQEEEAES
ncbi:MAG: putative domain nuclease [Chthoniobacteraceae bacterium]|nr:putative domain nuclease [Chthoniobacteraceae bacterium]